MQTLLITYDLNKPGQDYSDFYKIIKSYAWAKLSESSYAISTLCTPREILDQLRPYVDDGDNVYIVTLITPYSGRGPEDVNAWLRDKLVHAYS